MLMNNNLIESGDTLNDPNNIHNVPICTPKMTNAMPMIPLFDVLPAETRLREVHTVAPGHCDLESHVITERSFLAPKPRPECTSELAICSQRLADKSKMTATTTTTSNNLKAAWTYHPPPALPPLPSHINAKVRGPAFTESANTHATKQHYDPTQYSPHLSVYTNHQGEKTDINHLDDVDSNEISLSDAVNVLNMSKAFSSVFYARVATFLATIPTYFGGKGYKSIHVRSLFLSTCKNFTLKFGFPPSKRDFIPTFQSEAVISHFTYSNMHYVAAFSLTRIVATLLMTVLMIYFSFANSPDSASLAAKSLTQSLSHFFDSFVAMSALCVFTYADIVALQSKLSKKIGTSKFFPFSFGLDRLTVLLRFTYSSSTVFVCLYRIFEGLHSIGHGHDHASSTSSTDLSSHGHNDAGGHGHGHGLSHTVTIDPGIFTFLNASSILSFLWFLFNCHSLVFFYFSRGQESESNPLISSSKTLDGADSKQNPWDYSSQGEDMRLGEFETQKQWRGVVKNLGEYFATVAGVDFVSHISAYICSLMGLADSGPLVAYIASLVILVTITIKLIPEVKGSGSILMQAVGTKQASFKNVKMKLESLMRYESRLISITESPDSNVSVNSPKGHVSFRFWAAIPQIVVTAHVYVIPDGSNFETEILLSVRRAILDGLGAESKDAIVTVEVHKATDLSCALVNEVKETEDTNLCNGQHHDHGHANAHAHSHGHYHSHGQSHDHSHGDGHCQLDSRSHEHSHQHYQEQGHEHLQSHEQGHGHGHGHKHGNSKKHLHNHEHGHHEHHDHHGHAHAHGLGHAAAHSNVKNVKSAQNKTSGQLFANHLNSPPLYNQGHHLNANASPALPLVFGKVADPKLGESQTNPMHVLLSKGVDHSGTHGVYNGFVFGIRDAPASSLGTPVQGSAPSSTV